jgi:hypothetical protein
LNGKQRQGESAALDQVVRDLQQFGQIDFAAKMATEHIETVLNRASGEQFHPGSVYMTT